MTENPYDILGVPKDATAEEIKAAAKRHAKESHPDAGGDADEFHRGRRALMVLSDPKRRKRFDQTGRVEEEANPDHVLQAAMQVIHHQLATATNGYLMNGFAADRDPRRMDVFEIMRGVIATDITKGHQTVADGRRHAEFLRDFVKRFKERKKPRGLRKKPAVKVLPFDFIKRQIEDEIAQVESKIETVEHSIKVAETALDLLEFYDFEWSPPEPVYAPAGMYSMGVARY